MNTFMQKATALVVLSVFLVLLYFSGSREVYWKTQYEIATTTLTRAEIRLEIKDENSTRLHQEVREAREDYSACHKVNSIIINDTEKLAIMRREFAICERSLREGIVKNLHGN